MSERGQDPAVAGVILLKLQLLEYRSDVFFDAGLGKEQFFRDCLVRSTLCHQREDGAFAGREPLHLYILLFATDQLGNNFGIEDRGPTCDLFQRGNELVHIRDAVFEQVPE